MVHIFILQDEEHTLSHQLLYDAVFPKGEHMDLVYHKHPLQCQAYVCLIL